MANNIRWGRGAVPARHQLEYPRSRRNRRTMGSSRRGLYGRFGVDPVESAGEQRPHICRDVDAKWQHHCKYDRGGRELRQCRKRTLRRIRVHFISRGTDINEIARVRRAETRADRRCHCGAADDQQEDRCPMFPAFHGAIVHPAPQSLPDADAVNDLGIWSGTRASHTAKSGDPVERSGEDARNFHRNTRPLAAPVLQLVLLKML